MKRARRAIPLLLALVMVISLCACGNSTEPETASESNESKVEEVRAEEVGTYLMTHFGTFETGDSDNDIKWVDVGGLDITSREIVFRENGTGTETTDLDGDKTEMDFEWHNGVLDFGFSGYTGTYKVSGDNLIVRETADGTNVAIKYKKVSP